ncbi:MAG: hypothetical protein EBZ13_11120 [Planctomycetia bacterium]|nr:hypothetical protein [Planctomycetia bacterium]
MERAKKAESAQVSLAVAQDFRTSVRLCTIPNAAVAKTSTSSSPGPHASKPEAQAEGTSVFDPQTAFPRLAARASRSSVPVSGPSKITVGAAKDCHHRKH